MVNRFDSSADYFKPLLILHKQNQAQTSSESEEMKTTPNEGKTTAKDCWNDGKNYCNPNVKSTSMYIYRTTNKLVNATV